MNSYLAVLKKYAVFEGRATRKEFWLFMLISLIITFALAMLDGALGTFNEEAGMGLLMGIYTLLVFVPSLAVSIRRLHDTGKSGWWYLVSLVPLIGTFILIGLLCVGSQPIDNQYGPNPQETKAE